MSEPIRKPDEDPSRVESILSDTIGLSGYEIEAPRSRIEILLLELEELIKEGGGGGESSNYGTSISIEMDSNFVMSASLLNKDGEVLGEVQTIDLPLESVVVNGSYDSINKQVVLTLQNGSTIRFSVADLVDGLQTEITSQNLLNADLVSDSNSIHKFATAAQLAQIETNKNNISLLMENGAQNKIISEKSAYDSTYNGYFDATAGFIENVGYKSFVFEVDKNTTIYTISHNATYFSICVYPDSDLTNGVRYRYKSGEDTLPYADNPLNLSRGQYVALTVAVGNSQPLEFIANLTNYVSIKQLGDEINLNAAQIAQATTGKANLIKYNSTASGKYTESVDIYTPTITGYIHYNFAHGVDANINANIWHITKAYYCDDELVDIFKLTYDGEWELALKPLNAPDFAAGMAHGDQIMNGISWFIDGYATDITEITEITPFAELKVVETSTLYNPITPTDILATTGIEYLWTCEKLTLNQAVNFNLADAMQFEMAYIGMHLPYKSITDHYYVDTNYAPTLCTGNYGTKTNTKDISVYGENTGVFTHFWVDSTPTGYRHSDDISLRDNGGLPYNKCYNIVIEGSTDNTVPAGVTTWRCKCNYSFSVNLQ